MPEVKDISIDQLLNLYERKRVALTQQVIDDLLYLFDEFATKSAYLAAKRRLVNNKNLPKDLRAAIDKLEAQINVKAREVLINGIKKTWILSEEKNYTLETKVISGGRKPPGGRTIISATASPNSPKGRREIYTAVDAFVKRKRSGMTLSKRVFKLSNVYKKVISDALTEGIQKGTSARDLAKLTRKAVRNPELQNPGRGVYKSPQKNALRLTRNEINLAYANADYVRWQQTEAIIGIEIRLSNRHPKYDMCDELKGRYPKTFHFTKWHVNCLCIAIPILASKEIRDQLMDYRFGLAEKPIIPYITKMPAKAIQWMQKNADRVNGWNSKPYWIRENIDFVGQYFN